MIHYGRLLALDLKGAGARPALLLLDHYSTTIRGAQTRLLPLPR